MKSQYFDLILYKSLISKKIWFFLLFVGNTMLFSCSNDSTNDDANGKPLFKLLSTDKTHIDFKNILDEGLNTNILVYEYFYNGGGVATADFNQDGLDDIYFVSNMEQNKFYLNKGKLEFEDISDLSGAMGRPGPWKTGVTTVDINSDGKLDIYLCYSGAMPSEKRKNQLFVNQGNDAQGKPKFVDEAEKYGLASSGFSNQAYFFDVDNDHDLDMVLLNHNPKNLPILNEQSTAEFLKVDSPEMGLRLFKQNNGSFSDVSQTSGISSSALSYGLGLGISDINKDGWLDFYVSNDYAVPDYLYLNNKNGTFSNILSSAIGHTSQFSMGNDIADINNDNQEDIFTLDMLPEDNERQKLLMAADNYSKFDLNEKSGFYYQYMRNMLHLNNGNNTFSEIGQLAGISNTDWSWSALFADYNNDGWKDLLVTNGYKRDYTNLDFIKYMDDYVKEKGRLQREDVLEIIEKMPASNVVNYIFKNKGDLTFSNETKNWGLGTPSNSNGAAYSDLDNDGDLDLVINNINKEAFIYENNANLNKDRHHLSVELKGDLGNSLGIGTNVLVYTNGQSQSITQTLTRGYLSSVSPIIHFGVGNQIKIDSVCVIWPNNKSQTIKSPKIDSKITVFEKDALNSKEFRKIESPLFTDLGINNFQHLGSDINDFYRQNLLINEFSHAGPCLSKGDFNEDGLEDVFVGGGLNQAASLFMQNASGNFSSKSNPAFEVDKAYLDVSSVAFDANLDGHLDIYVANGGFHQFENNDAIFQDRLYFGDGKGNFTKGANSLPQMLTSKGVVRVCDVNADGKPDVFVGSRVSVGEYPKIPKSYLMVNDGKGNFKDQIKTYAPDLEYLGMISDAAWVDLGSDKKFELVLVGEWMPLKVYGFEKNKAKDLSSEFFDKDYIGWWNSITVGDFNKDHKADLFLGNVGLNTQFKVSDNQKASLYAADFDKNGSIDPLFSFWIQGKDYPYVTRDELLNQIPSFRPKYIDYQSYSKVETKNLFDKGELDDAQKLEANFMETALFMSGKEKEMTIQKLPIQAQFSNVTSAIALDADNDGNLDLVLAGNNLHSKLRLGRYDANYGTFLKGDGKGNFTYVNQTKSGFSIVGEVKYMLQIGDNLVFGIHNKPLKIYRKNSI